jgi:hypothetical protein
MQVISNFLLVMLPPSPPTAAIISPGRGKFCWIELMPQQCSKSSTSTGAQIFDRNQKHDQISVEQAPPCFALPWSHAQSCEARAIVDCDRSPANS